ncbi:SET domain-containing protein-lysine N-methyltransferase [Amycolatopsis sp. NPDC058986]|uniref:SET domain-containing protein-lysine N-methyltransferase n=1 Tax=unclassified Amycolatopsis TaxID=2618356 RepID=UPI0036713A49
MGERWCAGISRLVGVLREAGEYRLVVTQPVAAGTCLFTIGGEVTGTPTRYTVQVGAGEHIDVPPDCGNDEVQDLFSWRFMNHSCEPTVEIRGRKVFSVRAIGPWQEITFNYNTTEYEMVEPFACRCGAASCQEQIRGFRFLPAAERERLRPWLAGHLLSILDSELDDRHVVGH